MLGHGGPSTNETGSDPRVGIESETDGVPPRGKPVPALFGESVAQQTYNRKLFGGPQQGTYRSNGAVSSSK